MKTKVDYLCRCKVSVCFEFSEEERELIKRIKKYESFEFCSDEEKIILDGISAGTLRRLEGYGLLIIGEESGFCRLSKLGEIIVGIR